MTESLVTCSYRTGYCNIMLIGDITPDSAIRLCASLEDAVEYYQYRHVVLKLNSPGGHAASMHKIIGEMTRLRRLYPELIFETVADVECSSAAFLILAMGTPGYRRAERYSSITPHFVRAIMVKASITARCAEGLASRLQEMDDNVMRELRTHILEGVTEADAEACVAEWRSLFDRDQPANLQTLVDLKLIDVIGAGLPRLQVSPSRVTHSGESSTIDRWSPLSGLPADKPAFMKMLTRHVMALGGTGSGKTKSVILPVLDVLLADDACSALVIDPKGDLSEHLIADHGRHPLITLGEEGQRLWVFQDVDVSDGEILFDTMSCIAGSGLGNTTPREPYWATNARTLFCQTLLTFQSIVRRNAPQARVEREHLDVLIDWLHSLDINPWPGLRLDACGAEAPSLLELVHRFLSDRDSVQKVARVEGGGLVSYAGMADTTYFSVLACLSPLIHLLTSRPFRALLDIRLYPPANEYCAVTTETLAAPTWFLYRPQSTPAGYAAARAIKRSFFRASLARRPGEDHNLFAYVADEAHHFVTFGEKYSEQNYLDRCRSFNCAVIVATQAVQNLICAARDNDTDINAVRMLLNNLCTRMYFNTNDSETAEQLRLLIPRLPDKPHILDVRPLSCLNEGECYFVTASGGHWGRGQIQPPETLPVRCSLAEPLQEHSSSPRKRRTRPHRNAGVSADVVNEGGA